MMGLARRPDLPLVGRDVRPFGAEEDCERGIQDYVARMWPTPRVSLRALALDDARAIASWGSDDAFCRAAGWTVGLDGESHARFQERLIAQPPPDLVRLGVQEHDDLVGYVDLHGDEPARRELGFVIGPRSVWGRGIGTQAARAGLVHGFTVMHLDEVWAEALEDNVASTAVLLKVGMSETGPGEEGDYAGAPSRYRQFSISADEFARLDGPLDGATWE